MATTRTAENSRQNPTPASTQKHPASSATAEAAPVTAPAPEAAPKLWNRNFVLIIVINLLVFVNHIMNLSTFPYYVRELGGTEALAGIVATAFSLVAVVLRPFIGWMLDNGARRAVLIAGLIGLALAPLGYVTVPVLSAVIVFRMIHGASLALSNTTTSTVASDIIPKPRFAEGMGYFGMATALATAAAPALGLMLMESFGFPVLFGCAIAIALAALALFQLVRTPRIRVERKPFSAKSLVNPDALPASAIMLLFMLTFGALENFLAIFATNESLPSGGLYFAIMAVMLLLVRVFLGRVVDTRGEAIFVYTCNAAMLAALLLLAIAPSPATFVLSAILSGYGFGGLEPALQSMAVHTASLESRGSANSTFLCAYDIGIGVGAGIAGALITALGYEHMWMIMAVANVASVAIYVAWGRNHPSSFSRAHRMETR